ncbi:hypothetical protein E9993_11765 [Labilibacter sediminis]|nr:hypothetical protein E9993_11765 [Labilibacter sediminis]
MTPKTLFFEHQLSECKNEYENHMSGFNLLDNKAYQVLGFSGLLLGLSVSFLQQETLDFIMQTRHSLLYLIIFSILMLLLSIITGIVSVRIIKIKGVPSHHRSTEEYEDLKPISDDKFDIELYQNFISNKIRRWIISIENIKEANKRKAQKVFLSQLFCSMGLIIFGVIGVIIVLGNL